LVLQIPTINEIDGARAALTEAPDAILKLVPLFTVRRAGRAWRFCRYLVRDDHLDWSPSVRYVWISR